MEARHRRGVHARAYGKGYCDALTEESPGLLCQEHGYRVPPPRDKRTPDGASPKVLRTFGDVGGRRDFARRAYTGPSPAPPNDWRRSLTRRSNREKRVCLTSHKVRALWAKPKLCSGCGSAESGQAGDCARCGGVSGGLPALHIDLRQQRARCSRASSPGARGDVALSGRSPPPRATTARPPVPPREHRREGQRHGRLRRRAPTSSRSAATSR